MQNKGRTCIKQDDPSKRSLSFRSPLQNIQHISLLPQICPYYLLWFEWQKCIWFWVQIMQFLITQFLPSSCYFPLQANISFSAPSSQIGVTDHMSHSNKTRSKIIILYILIVVFKQQTRSQKFKTKSQQAL